MGMNKMGMNKMGMGAILLVISIETTDLLNYCIVRRDFRNYELILKSQYNFK